MFFIAAGDEHTGFFIRKSDSIMPSSHSVTAYTVLFSSNISKTLTMPLALRRIAAVSPVLNCLFADSSFSPESASTA